MTHEHLQTILATVPTSPDETGWSKPPAERQLTLYAAHDSVPLTVNKVVGVKVEGDIVHAVTHKGERFSFEVADLFAIALDQSPLSDRKAGFAPGR